MNFYWLNQLSTAAPLLGWRSRCCAVAVPRCRSSASQRPRHTLSPRIQRKKLHSLDSSNNLKVYFLVLLDSIFQIPQHPHAVLSQFLTSSPPGSYSKAWGTTKKLLHNFRRKNLKIWKKWWKIEEKLWIWRKIGGKVKNNSVEFCECWDLFHSASSGRVKAARCSGSTLRTSMLSLHGIPLHSIATMVGTTGWHNVTPQVMVQSEPKKQKRQYHDGFIWTHMDSWTGLSCNVMDWASPSCYCCNRIYHLVGLLVLDVRRCIVCIVVV